MAQITKPHTFVDATAMIAGQWNADYDTLYNELNGNLNNSNFKASAAIVESKLGFDGNAGHDHSGSSNGETINIAAGLSTSGVKQGDIAYFNGSNWALLGTGANNTILKVGYDSYTKLMLHCDGADASTAFVDDMGKTVTSNNGAQLDTAQIKFGTASGLFDGIDDYLTLADSDDWYFGTGDFTIDFWVKFNSLTNIVRFCGQFVDVDTYWEIIKDTNASNNSLQIRFITGGVYKGNYSLGTWSGAVVDRWYHLAFERNGTSALLFIDGVSQSLTELTAFGTNDVGNTTSSLYIGQAGSSQNYLNGWIDEFRISKGIARWTSNFTPPTTQYPLGLVWGAR